MPIGWILQEHGASWVSMPTTTHTCTHTHTVCVHNHSAQREVHVDAVLIGEIKQASRFFTHTGLFAIGPLSLKTMFGCSGKMKET